MQLDARRLFLAAVVASLCATAAIAIFTLLLGDFGETEGRILLTTAAISLYSLLSLPAGALLDQGRLRPLALANLALAVLGFLLALNLIWIEWDDAGDASWKSLVVVTAAAGALAQVGGVESRRRDGDAAWVRNLAIASHASAVLLAALISIAALEEVEDDGYYRALGAVAVANVLLVALQPVLRRMAGAAPAAGRVHRFVCFLDAPPAELPERGYRRRSGNDAAVECELGGRDFAGAVERAIRELERGGRRVVRVERAD